MGYGLNNRRTVVRLPGQAIFFSLPKRPFRLKGPLSFVLHRSRVSTPGEDGRSVQAPIHSHLVPRSRMSGPKPPFPYVVTQCTSKTSFTTVPSRYFFHLSHQHCRPLSLQCAWVSKNNRPWQTAIKVYVLETWERNGDTQPHSLCQSGSSYTL
jgi:hypothetical protein